MFCACGRVWVRDPLSSTLDTFPLQLSDIMGEYALLVDRGMGAYSASKRERLMKPEPTLLTIPPTFPNQPSSSSSFSLVCNPGLERIRDEGTNIFDGFSYPAGLLSKAECFFTF